VRGKLYLYTYKLNIVQGRPSMRWLWKCKWFYVAYDERLQDKLNYVISELERKEYPFVKLGIKTRIRGLIVVKQLKTRDFLSFWVPNALYDAILSKTRLNGLEAMGLWNIEELEADPELEALYAVGKNTTIKSRITELKKGYEDLKEDRKG
jgi:hypothetical protein